MCFFCEMRDLDCGLFISLRGPHIGKIHCKRRIGRMSDMRQFLSQSFLRIWPSRPSQILRQQYIHRFKNGKNAPHRQDNLLDIILQLGFKLQTLLTITPRIIILSSPNCVLVTHSFKPVPDGVVEVSFIFPVVELLRGDVDSVPWLL
jgi:hypothetical protein